MSQESHDLGPTPTLLTLAGYGDGYVCPGDEVYVVSEDTDYIYRNTGANPPADGFNIIKAVFLPGIWERRNNVPAGAGVGASALRFNTIAVGAVGSGRLIDVALAGLIDGTSLAWTESVKDTWRWDATSVLVADNITVANPIANGANPGRFIRQLEPAPEWLQQAAWFIDTAGNNENDGSSALTALQTDVEIQRRWGLGMRARLPGPVTITYAQSPITTTNYYVELVVGAQLVLVGTPTVSKAGTVLTAVQVQVRTAGAELGWAITAPGLDATDVGKIAVITASGTPANIGAYAGIVKDEGGGKLRVVPFGKFAFSTTFFTQVTPLVGDTIEIREMTTQLSIGTVEVRSASDQGNSGTNSITYSAFRQLKLTGSTTQFCGAIEQYRLPAFYDMCVFNGILLGGRSGGLGNAQHLLCGGVAGVVGGAVTSVAFRAGTTASVTRVGFIVQPGLSAGSIVTIQADTYFQNCVLPIPRDVSVATLGAAFFDRTVADACIVVNSGSFCQQVGAVPDWGTNNAGHGVVVASSATYNYTTKPTVNSGLGAGREARVGGTDKIYGAVPFVEPANNAALVLIA